jgi:hypothetical protein
MEAVEGFAIELLEETVGTSRKKWALLVVALVAGALGVRWLVRRRRSGKPAVAANSQPAPESGASHDASGG